MSTTRRFLEHLLLIIKCAAVVGLQVSSESQVKKLEEQLSESTRRGDDLQRVLTEFSVAKNRLTGNSTQLKLSQVSFKTQSLCWFALIQKLKGLVKLGYPHQYRPASHS